MRVGDAADAAGSDAPALTRAAQVRDPSYCDCRDLISFMVRRESMRAMAGSPRSRVVTNCSTTSSMFVEAFFEGGHGREVLVYDVGVDDDLQGTAQGRGVDEGGVRGDDAVGLEPADPAQTGAGVSPTRGGELLLVGRPSCCSSSMMARSRSSIH